MTWSLGYSTNIQLNQQGNADDCAQRTQKQSHDLRELIWTTFFHKQHIINEMKIREIAFVRNRIRRCLRENTFESK